jgi:PKD domain-containing protein/putative Ig domain-containing protein/HYDIN/CFA65/VesB family protein
MRIGIIPTALALCIFAINPATAAAGNAQVNDRVALSSSAASRATAVSGPIIGIQPAGLDFGIVTTGTTATRDYTVRNTGDADLEITDVLISDPQVTTDQPAPMILAPGGSVVATATFTPTGGPLRGTLEVRSNATNGSFIVPLAGFGNHAPVLDPIAPIAAIAWIPVQFTVHATDLDDDPILLSASGLPAGAAFDVAGGTFSWTPTADDGGAHTITFRASDGNASGTLDVTITVTVLNHPPIAVPGGAYVGTVGLPITFDGSRSRDPDGQNLVFHWAFGDGGTGEGERTVYAYARAGS